MLADHQLAQVLQVGQAFEEENALDQFVGFLQRRLPSSPGSTACTGNR